VATVALLVRTVRTDAAELAASTAAWLDSLGHRARVLRIDPEDKVREDGVVTDLSAVDLSDVDLAVSLGGDGTFLRVAPIACTARVPVMGVNFGRLGYLMEIAPDALRQALRRALDGELAVEERSVLSISVDGEITPSRARDRFVADAPDLDVDAGVSGGRRSWMALNEVVTEKTVPGHTVHLATSIDGELFLEYSADGVIVATPTGSTAYNLSAGGPALSPRLAAMILTPIAPHLSIDRSLVLDAGQTVTVNVSGGRPAVLVVDGRDVGRLSPGAQVTCRIATEPVRVLSLGERGFAGDLRSALAIDPRR